MERAGHAVGIVIAAVATIVAMPALAQVRDAIYRGTLICDKLPFTEAKMREAIDVTIASGKVRYSHVVRLRGGPEGMPERGTGTLEGQNLALEGVWDGGARKYKASYSGTFVRRSAKLKGTQTWTEGGRTFTRACSGVVKRPFRVFLPREGRKPAGE
jgi:hypothetical protein